MNLENKRLHQPPKPWVSLDKNLVRDMIIFNIIVWMLVILMLYTAFYNSDFTNMLYLLSGVLILIGIFAYLYARKKSRDQKATWDLPLPYDLYLYGMLKEKVPVMLQEHGYEYFQSKVAGLYPLEIDQDTRKVKAYSYTIKCTYGNKIALVFGLTYHDSIESSTSRFFKMKIINVQMDDISTATKLAFDVNNLIKEIESDGLESALRKSYL